MKAYLVLEDGSAFKGESFGAEGESFGELVFNTSMAGYQEILTDPSYNGQIVTMTYPLIGNYGVNDEDVESCKPWTEGFVIKELGKMGCICFRYCPGVWPTNRLKTTLMYSGCSKPESSEIRSKVKSVSESNCLMRLT